MVKIKISCQDKEECRAILDALNVLPKPYKIKRQHKDGREIIHMSLTVSNNSDKIKKDK